MSRSLDDFLHKGFLLLKVGLKFENPLVAACCGIGFTFIFALSTQSCLV